MMKHIWSVLCKKAIIDRETNSLSLLESLEQITITLPSQEAMNSVKGQLKIPLEFELVSFWVEQDESKKKEINMLIEVYDPDNVKIHSAEKKIEVPENSRRMRILSKITGLRFTKAGVYTLKVSNKAQQKYHVVAEIPLEILLEFTSDATK